MCSWYVSQAAQEEQEALEAQLASEKTRRDEAEHEAGSCKQVNYTVIL